MLGLFENSELDLYGEPSRDLCIRRPHSMTSDPVRNVFRSIRRDIAKARREIHLSQKQIVAAVRGLDFRRALQLSAEGVVSKMALDHLERRIHELEQLIQSKK